MRGCSEGAGDRGYLCERDLIISVGGHAILFLTILAWSYFFFAIALWQHLLNLLYGPKVHPVDIYGPKVRNALKVGDSEQKRFDINASGVSGLRRYCIPAAALSSLRLPMSSMLQQGCRRSPHSCQWLPCLILRCLSHSSLFLKRQVPEG